SMFPSASRTVSHSNIGGSYERRNGDAGAPHAGHLSTLTAPSPAAPAAAQPAAVPRRAPDWLAGWRPLPGRYARPDSTGGRFATTSRRGRRSSNRGTAAAGPVLRPRRWAYLPRPNTPRTRPAATTRRP